MKKVFSGSAVALITPFKDDKVDFESLGKLIDFQLENKTDAIVILGTTGEPATLSQEEKKEIIKFSKRRINGETKFIVGTGANSTEKVIKDSMLAQKYGAEALLIVTPYYNKCTQNGIIKHYEKVASKVNIPIIVYNVPSRTGVNILPQTALELSKIPNICGIKEASGSINQIISMFKLLKDKMAIYSGDDSLNYVFMSLGASGCISVSANIVPKEIRQVMTCALSGDLKKALEIQEELYDINKDLFIEVNPIPVKYACSLLGLCRNEIRLPLTELEDKNKEILKNTLIKFGFKV